MKTVLVLLATVFLTMCLDGNAQENTETTVEHLKSLEDRLNNRLDVLDKKIDDIIWFERVGEVAFIDKVYMTGPPLREEKNPSPQRHRHTARGSISIKYIL